MLIYLVSGSSHLMTKEIDEEGVMEVKVIPRIKYCLYFTNAKYIIIMFSPCAVQNINLKQEKYHTVPHQSLYEQ